MASLDDRFMTAEFMPGAALYLEDLKKLIDRLDVKQISTVMDRLLDAYHRRASVYIFGSGGSADTASHFVNDFNKGVSEGLAKGFRFYCLNDNLPPIFAPEDGGGAEVERVFRMQLENYLRDGDLVLAISAGGNSASAVEAIRYAQSRNIETIGLVGYGGGELKRMVDYCIHVEIADVQKVEDVHLMVNHIMMALFRDYFRGVRPPAAGASSADAGVAVTA
ncbi:SIS domain-containing protein [Polymorphospora rubra]|uniref:SIS domain-containing protein n=1 Tax=Polymorphospora rubra TaxID=338584 RepID=UPI0033FFFF2D